MAASSAVIAKTRTGTKTLFEGLWNQYAGKSPTDSSKTAAISAMLKELAEALERNLTKSLPLYVAALWDLSPQELVLGFTRATEEDSFFPALARLRELSGREPQGDPLEREAKAALHVLLARMRRHGWQLKPELGRIIRTSGDDGRLLMEPEREPTIHHNLPPRTLQAIAMMGWGDHMRGLALMREHPGIANPPDMDAEYKVNALKQADELQRRWIECYRQAGM